MTEIGVNNGSFMIRTTEGRKQIEGFLPQFRVSGSSFTLGGLVNDTYKMDLILVHPPHLIALACIYIASVIRDKDTTAWFEELRVDMNVCNLRCLVFDRAPKCISHLRCPVKNISMEILDFYESHRMFTEERINAALQKLTLRP
ncbi:hypothetical protein V8G54_021436 [Vigna mungo]|uniref:Uncharacterized protein n=1 Tax=Vigna mungo TaxID=3915 RepID=A0AAQ3NE38_VIGMU